MVDNTYLSKELNNINIDTVENCNLLCKLVMDYVSTETCKIDIVNDYVSREQNEQKKKEVLGYHTLLVVLLIIEIQAMN